MVTGDKLATQYGQNRLAASLVMGSSVLGQHQQATESAMT